MKNVWAGIISLLDKVKRIPQQYPIIMRAHIGLFAILIYGSLAALNQVHGIKNSPLDPDATTYMAIARGLSWHQPFHTDFREPAWVWLVKIVMFIGGDYPETLRYMGVMLFVITSAFLYFLTLSQSRSQIMATIAGMAFTTNAYLANLAARGLRDMGFIFILVAFTYFILKPNFRDRLRSNLSMTILTATLLVGIRINSLLLLLCGLFWLMLHQRVPLIKASLIIMLPVLFIWPYIKYSQETFNDPLYSSNVHAKWWRNYEFVLLKGTGCQGCPPADGLTTNMYAGPPVSAFDYIFKMRSPETLFKDTIKGYWALLFDRTSNYFNILLGTSALPIYLAYLLGVIETLRRNFRWILAVPLIAMNFIPFTATINMDPRIFTPFAPFMSFVLAAGAYRIILSLFQANKYIEFRFCSAVVSRQPNVGIAENELPVRSKS